MKSRMRFALGALVWPQLKFLLLGFIFSFGLCFSVNADSLWQAIKEDEISIQARPDALISSPNSNTISPAKHSFENANLMTLNEKLMRDLLHLDSSGVDYTNHKASPETSAKSLFSSNKYEISLPLPSGEIIDLTLVRASLLPTQLAAKYANIHSYRVLANKQVFGGRVDFNPNGFHAMLQMLDGEVVFVDPVAIEKSQYAIYHKSAQRTEANRQHRYGANDILFANRGFAETVLNSSLMSPAKSKNLSQRSENSLKNYTIAIATTGEYSANFDSDITATMAAIVTTLNRVNQVLERDLGIRLHLVENNDLLINTDANTDPFINEKLIDLVSQNQTFIDSVIGNSHYDIGHLFTTKGGGLAAIGSVCDANHKAKAASGITSPKGDSFDLDYVAHEIGHQLGATHTFNSIQGACSTQTREAKSAFEPGSGSTIMSYAGFCGLDNIQASTDAMYHIGSIKQITAYTDKALSQGCGIVSTLQNKPPVADAGDDYSIPARTPFELSGSAIDEDKDALVYAWEQLDAGDASTESSDKGNNALFRVHIPNASKTRSFPPLQNILNNQPSRGESLPSYQRNLTMSFVAQDGFNPAVSDEMLVKVIRTGSRFALNYPRAFYTRGNIYSVFWNVANTDQAPINCSSVNVLLSADGGNNFNYAVASNVPNNGETSVTIPVDIPVSSQGRFKLTCSDNIFFAISNRNFFITDSDSSLGIEYNNEDQPETELKDLPIDPSELESNSETSISSRNSGGGIFDFLMVFLSILWIRTLFFGTSE